MGEIIKVHLVGYQETPLTINSPGRADFTAKIHSDGTAIDYELTYRDLSSTVLQSHIHFGRPAITGGIVLFPREGNAERGRIRSVASGQVLSQERLGGLHHRYDRAA